MLDLQWWNLHLIKNVDWLKKRLILWISLLFFFQASNQSENDDILEKPYCKGVM